MRLTRRFCEGGLLTGAVALGVIVGLGVTPILAAEPGGSGGSGSVTVDPNKVPVASPPTTNSPQPNEGIKAPVRQPGMFRLPPPPTTQPTSQPELTGPPPAVKVDELTYDFGKVMGLDSVAHTFKLKNTGEGTLTIASVQPQCGCTTAGNWAKTVAPGATWELPITLRVAGADGKLVKTITVRTNDPKMREFRYTLTGEVRARFTFKPMRHFQLGRCQRDSVTRSKITITDQLETPIVLKSATVDNKSFTAELREIKPGKEYEIEVATVPPLNEGFTQAKVTVETDCKEEPKFDMWIYAQVPPRLTLSPTVLAVPSPLLQDTKRSLTFRNEGETPVHVKEVTVSDPAVRSEINATEDGKLYQIWLMVPKGTSVPMTGQTITVVTDDAKMPKFTAQLRGYPARPPTTGPAFRPATTTRPVLAPQALRRPGVK